MFSYPHAMEHKGKEMSHRTAPLILMQSQRMDFYRPCVTKADKAQRHQLIWEKPPTNKQCSKNLN